MNFEHERGVGFWSKRAFFIPIAIVAGVFIFSGVVMLLWNAVLPAVIGVHTVTYWQAMCILVLSKIIFGGFKGMHDHGHQYHRHRHMERDLREKWMQMDPQEREKMRSELKNEWKQRFGHTVKPE